MSNSVTPGAYRHYKGDKYEVLMIAYHAHIMKRFVVYKSVTTGKVWTQSIDDFCKIVSNEKGMSVRRFVPI